MTKDELRAKYVRVLAGFSEIGMLKDQLLESGLLDVAQKDPANAGKVIKVNEAGELDSGEAESIPQLYRHYVRLNTNAEPGREWSCDISFSSFDSTPITTAAALYDAINNKSIRHGVCDDLYLSCMTCLYMYNQEEVNFLYWDATNSKVAHETISVVENELLDAVTLL